MNIIFLDRREYMFKNTDYIDVTNTISSAVVSIIVFNAFAYLHPILRIVATLAASLLTLIVVDGTLETLRRRKEQKMPVK